MEKLTQMKSGTLSHERRKFIKKSGALAAMSLFGVSFFTACENEEDTYPSTNNPSNSSDGGITVNSNTVVIDLGKVTDLQNAGDWILIVSAQMLVVNTGGEFSSLTSVCTHSGCDRNWSLNSSNEFVCSCHGSIFTTDGNVVAGPANTPLRQFTNEQSGDILTISRS